MSAVLPRATVITPVFNSARTLRRAVTSALGQTLRNLEVIVVDDGSTDGSRLVAEELAREDSRVRVVGLPKNRGKPHAMNLAGSMAAGEWIAVLDADDWYEPDRLERLLAAAEASSAEMVADNQYFFDEGAGRIVGTAFAAGGEPRLLDRAGFARGCDPYADFDLGMLKPVVRSRCVRDNKLRYREDAKLSEDFFFLVEFLAADGRLLLVPEPLYCWRQAFGSISRRWTDTGGGSWRYDYRSALAANDQLLVEMRGRGETLLSDLLAVRGRAFRRLALLAEANRLRSEGRFLAAIFGVILPHPTVLSDIARRVLRRRTSRHRKRHQELGYQPVIDEIDDRRSVATR